MSQNLNYEHISIFVDNVPKVERVDASLNANFEGARKEEYVTGYIEDYIH